MILFENKKVKLIHIIKHFSKPHHSVVVSKLVLLMSKTAIMCK